MKRANGFRKYWRFWSLAIAIFLLTVGSMIPLRLAIARYQAPFPQAILTLGGGQEREEFTAQFAQQHPGLDIWISSGIGAERSQPIFAAAHIPPQRIHIDCRAIDTVTNFTTLVKTFHRSHLQHIYLITAAFHMARAKAIATIVLGSQGIVVTPVPIYRERPNASHPPETWHHILRDSLRSILWVLTGRTGASLNPNPPIPCT